MKADNLVIFHPSNKEELEALKAFAKALKIKFEIAKEKEYDKGFVEKIQESRKQVKEGKTVQIDLAEIWKD
jgi:uncharacterized membrane protein (DUF106 family)